MLDSVVKNIPAYTTEELSQPRCYHCLSNGEIGHIKMYLSFKESKVA